MIMFQPILLYISTTGTKMPFGFADSFVLAIDKIWITDLDKTPEFWQDEQYFKWQQQKNWILLLSALMRNAQWLKWLSI